MPHFIIDLMLINWYLCYFVSLSLFLISLPELYVCTVYIWMHIKEFNNNVLQGAAAGYYLFLKEWKPVSSTVYYVNRRAKHKWHSLFLFLPSEIRELFIQFASQTHCPTHAIAF